MAEYTWSFSSLKQYTNCPKQYYEIRVLKNYTVKENEAMMYGKEVHTALENYVKGWESHKQKLFGPYGQPRRPIEEIINGVTSKTWDKTHEELNLDKKKKEYKPLGRNDAGVRLCGLWFNKGFSFEEVREKVFEWNQLNKPPMDDKEVESIVKSMHKKHLKNLEDNPEPKLAKNYQRFKGMVDALINIKGEKICEHEMALTYNKEPCEFHDENRWVRGIADLVIIDGADAYVIDYKTGSNKYPDPKQLKLMAIMMFTHFPEVQKIKAGLLFVMKNSFLTEEYHRKDMDKLWKSFEQPLKRLETSYDTDEWKANPTPLCGWCSVDTCEFYKPRFFPS